MVETSRGDTIETAMIGRDGAVNASAALDHKMSMSKAVVLMPGLASVIDVKHLSDLSDRFGDLRRLLMHHQQVLFAEVQQSGACNAIDEAEARLARWLLRYRDLAESDELQVTQDVLAQMLAVRRPTVSLIAGILQRAGIIKYRRGHITILDVQALQDCACECYATVRGHYERLQILRF